MCINIWLSIKIEELYCGGCSKIYLMSVCIQMIDIITADTSPRPDGAPPTYDDAMKFVNDAFEHTEDTDVCVEKWRGS